MMNSKQLFVWSLVILLVFTLSVQIIEARPSQEKDKDDEDDTLKSTEDLIDDGHDNIDTTGDNNDKDDHDIDNPLHSTEQNKPLTDGSVPSELSANPPPPWGGSSAGDRISHMWFPELKCYTNNPCYRQALYCVTLWHMWSYELPDRDRIEVRTERVNMRPDRNSTTDPQTDGGLLLSDTIQMSFSVENHVHWWKAVQLFRMNARNRWLTLAELSNEQKGPLKFTVRRSLLSHYVLVFSKAKGLGVRTNMYCLRDALWAFQPGYSYHFKWTQDTA